MAEIVNKPLLPLNRKTLEPAPIPCPILDTEVMVKNVLPAINLCILPIISSPFEKGDGGGFFRGYTSMAYSFSLDARG
jgi:hypothetical protein